MYIHTDTLHVQEWNDNYYNNVTASHSTCTHVHVQIHMIIMMVVLPGGGSMNHM